MNEESTVTQEVTQELEKETSAFMNFIGDIEWQSLLIEAGFTLIKIILSLIAIYIVYRIVKYLINSFFQRKFATNKELPNRFKTIENITNSVILAATIFVASYTVLSLIGIPVGTLLAGAGVIGLAISFGAQGFVSDVINGFKIVFEEQMHVGDIVVLESIEGIVQQVGIQTSVVRDYEGVTHYIPNREIIIVSNKSRSSLRVLIQLPLYAETNLALVRDVINEVNEDLIVKFEKEITNNPDSVSFVPYSNGQVAAQIIMYTKPQDMFKVRNYAFETYVAGLNKAGVDLPDYVVTPPMAN